MCDPLTIGLLIAGGVAVGAGTTAIVANQQGGPQIPAVPQLPALPDPEVIKTQAKKDAQLRASLRTRTILTSGAGVIDEPNLEKKTILGG